MKFSQKLVCTMLLVVTAFFSVGGCLLVNGSFSDQLSAAAEQEKNMHAMLCGVVEDYYLDQSGAGGDTSGAGFVAEAAARAESTARGVYSHGLFLAENAEADPQAARLSNGQALFERSGGTILRVYRSDLLGGLVQVTAFDVTDIFTARSKSLRRLFLLEGGVLLGAAAVLWFVSRRLTYPLTVLTAASETIARGRYDLRTDIHTGDELEILGDSFNRMAAAVQRQVEALELSVQQRDDFVGAFTHELKTPMTSIIGYADLLRTIRPTPEEQLRSAGAIYHEARRLETLSGKLLQLMGLGENAPELKPVALAEVFGAAAHAAAPVLNGCRLSVQDGGLAVYGDADLLCDLILNFITNAVKASAPGSPIRVTARAKGETVLIYVADRGCGIPAEKLSRVAEPFYMVDKSRARRQGGSGLGLALCTRIVQAHHGTLAIKSREGRGTIMIVRLPAAPHPQALPGPEPQAVPPAPEPRGEPRRPRTGHSVRLKTNAARRLTPPAGKENSP